MPRPLTEEMISAGASVLTASVSQDLLEGFLHPAEVARLVLEAALQVPSRPGQDKRAPDQDHAGFHASSLKGTSPLRYGLGRVPSREVTWLPARHWASMYPNS